MKILLTLYIFSLPFVSAFAYSETLTFSLFFNVLILFWNILNFLVKPKLNALKSIPFTLSCLSLFLIILLLAMASMNFFYIKAINHFIAYSVCFLLFFLNLYIALVGSINIVDKRYLLKVLTITLTISAIFGIIEFASSNLFGLNLNEFIPRPQRANYKPVALGNIFRIRGFSTESSNHAFLLDCLAPLSIFYYNNLYIGKARVIKRNLFITLVIANLILSYSTAAFIVIGILIFLFFIRFFLSFVKLTFRHLLKLKTYIILVFLFFTLNFVGPNTLKYIKLVDVIERKIGNSGSAQDREGRFEDFVIEFNKSSILRKCIGYGPSGFRVAGLKKSFITFYLKLISEAGILGFMIFIIFLFINFIKLIQIKNSIRFYLFFSFSAAILHYMIIGDYWLPWFWFVCAIISYQYFIENKTSSILLKESKALAH